MGDASTDHVEQWFNGQVAVVTGAAQGLGYACAIEIARRGGTVIAADVKSCDALVAEANRVSGTVADIRVDVTDESDCKALVRTAEDAGGCDILINNAGIVDRSAIESLSIAQWNTVIETNLTGVFRVTRLLKPMLCNSQAGSIVNISSVLSLVGSANRTAYSASKGGIDALTRSLAAEFGPAGVRVNAVNPGFIRTEMNQELLDADREAEFANKTVGGTLGAPADVAQLVSFLASTHAQFITGETVRIDGGQAIRS